MAIELKMPALSPTMEEGKLARWLVKEGDEVASGDILAEIETDKATMEFEAVDEGTVGKILVAEGTEGVKVGTVIAVLAGEGEDASAVSAPAPRQRLPPPPKPRRLPRPKHRHRLPRKGSRSSLRHQHEDLDRPRSTARRHGRGNAPRSARLRHG